MDEAIALLEGAVELRPGFAQAHANLGAALSAAGRYRDAVAAFDNALREEDPESTTHTNLQELRDRAQTRAEARGD